MGSALLTLLTFMLTLMIVGDPQCLRGLLTLLTFKRLFSRVRQGKERARDLPSSYSRSLNGKMLTLLTLLTFDVNLRIVGDPQCLCGLLTLLTFKRLFPGVRRGKGRRRACPRHQSS
jgi:hypothetical protein